MERIKNNLLENPRGRSEQLDGKEKLEAILGLFGTDSARESFIENCEEYIKARNKAARESYSLDSSVRSRSVTSGPVQAIIHNKIMGTLIRLATQSQNISPLQREILREMHDRDVTAKIVGEYVASKNISKGNGAEEEDGRGRVSGAAYYHSLGKGN
jgi:hypothetical protein